jgi:hypothetical protein
MYHRSIGGITYWYIDNAVAIFFFVEDSKLIVN